MKRDILEKVAKKKIGFWGRHKSTIGGTVAGSVGGALVGAYKSRNLDNTGLTEEEIKRRKLKQTLRYGVTGGIGGGVGGYISGRLRDSNSLTPRKNTKGSKRGGTSGRKDSSTTPKQMKKPIIPRSPVKKTVHKTKLVTKVNYPKRKADENTHTITDNFPSWVLGGRDKPVEPPPTLKVPVNDTKKTAIPEHLSTVQFTDASTGKKITGDRVARKIRKANKNTQLTDASSGKKVTLDKAISKIKKAKEKPVVATHASTGKKVTLDTKPEKQKEEMSIADMIRKGQEKLRGYAEYTRPTQYQETPKQKVHEPEKIFA